MTLGIVQVHMSYQGFHHRSVGKESAYNTSSIPGLRRSTGGGIGYPLQYSWASLGKESACNAGDLGLIPGLGRSPEEGKGFSSILAWRIPWTVESMGSQRIRHDWGTHFHFPLSWAFSKVCFVTPDYTTFHLKFIQCYVSNLLQFKKDKKISKMKMRYITL